MPSNVTLSPEQLFDLISGAAAAALKKRAENPTSSDEEVLKAVMTDLARTVEHAIGGKSIGKA